MRLSRMPGHYAEVYQLEKTPLERDYDDSYLDGGLRHDYGLWRTPPVFVGRNNR